MVISYFHLHSLRNGLIKTIVPFLLLTVVSAAKGQILSDNRWRDLFRNVQLQGTSNNEGSLCVNPNQVRLSDIDSILGPVPPAIKKDWVRLMPVTMLQQYNSQLPADWNDGSLIPAKGYQTRLSAGIFTRLGKHITIQLMPEYVYAANPSFDQFPQQLSTREWQAYYRFLNTSDVPERMGDGRYNKLFAGQSSIRYNFKAYSVGVSTENLWWGPGWRNSLIMSNTAPGFAHLTFNTTRPVRTSIGNFEGQVIGGRLDQSGVLPPRIYSVDPSGNFLYQPKPDQWRYITGMVLTWEPRWLKHLYLGISKASYLYPQNISNPLDVLPLQGFLGRTRTASERDHTKSSMGSLFARYVMPDDHAELYIEYGRKDLALMPWNVIQSDDYRRAYIAGLRKLIPLRYNAYLQVRGEIAQLEAPSAELINDPDSWYTDRNVRQGYTYLGQVLGAGVGTGSNSQTLDVSWYKGAKRIGLQLERVRYNNDFYFYAFQYLGDFRRHWIDLSGRLSADWNFGKLMVFAEAGLIRSYNYKWLIVQVDPANFFSPGNEVLNFSGKLSVVYRL